jgi:hypothetical protein
MIASPHKSILRAAAKCSVLALSGCVVTSGPAPATTPAAAPPPTLASTPASAPAATPVAPEPAPPQPPFAPTPEPPERPGEHPHGMARGMPKDLQPGHPETLWVWHDDNAAQWHVRSTTQSQEHRFNGRVWVSEGSIVNVHPSRIEFNDRIRSTGRSVEFDFHTRGGIDGFDFGIAGARCVHFALYIDGRGDAGRVKIGASSAHPKHHVFSMCP